MKHHGIISGAEALQILANDLRKAALEKHAEELRRASPEERAALLKEIEQEIKKELRKRQLRAVVKPFLHWRA